jgi:hypothetical protein
MDENKIKKYIKNGGELWNIKNIVTIRDGGTKMLIKAFGKKPLIPVYIHKDNWTLHSKYPTDVENIITDENELEYIHDKLDCYLSGCKHHVETTEFIINKLNKND